MSLPTIVLTTPSNNSTFLLPGRITVNPHHLPNTTNNNFHYALIDFYHYHTKSGREWILKNLETPIVNKRTLFTIPEEAQWPKDRCHARLSTTPKPSQLFTNWMKLNHQDNHSPLSQTWQLWQQFPFWSPSISCTKTLQNHITNDDSDKPSLNTWTSLTSSMTCSTN